MSVRSFGSTDSLWPQQLPTTSDDERASESPMAWNPRPVRRFRALVRSDPTGFGAGFLALVFSAFASLTAGLTLGAITGTLEDLPGLLVLVPAAIGMRGNVFGALGSRLGTAIHAGTFR